MWYDLPCARKAETFRSRNLKLVSLIPPLLLLPSFQSEIMTGVIWNQCHSPFSVIERSSIIVKKVDYLMEMANYFAQSSPFS